jgi:ABC-type nitrate/sulfonate/bicarbonate transport system permease component
MALPPLTKVVSAWFALVESGELVSNGAASLYRAAAGLGLSIVVGAGLGIVMAWWRPANLVLGPVVELLYPMPKSALIPVTVIWLGFGDGSKILLIFLGCMLPITIGAFNGARSSDRMLVWSARSMGASRLRMLWDVVVPSAMPELLNGVRTAIALSFILLVSSELIVARQGLGYLIGFLGADGAYEPMFAVVLTVAFLGFAADRAYQAVVARVLRWRD